MTIVQAVSPAHITGFFFPCHHDDPLRSGSLGAGLNLDLLVSTRVVARPGQGSLGWHKPEQALQNRVSHRVAELFHSHASNLEVELDQEQFLPVGYGLGSSGAGALSLALALNAALGFPVKPLVATQMAHRVEIEFKTGLGTVLAQTVGGLEMRMRAGAPGVGQVRPLSTQSQLWVQVALWEELNTSAVLNQNDFSQQAQRVGERCLTQLEIDPSWQNFMEQSSRFTQEMGLTTEMVGRVGNWLKSQGRLWAMPMFGQGVFWISETSEQELLQKLLDHFPKPAFYWSGHLAAQGAHLAYLHTHSS